MLKATVSVLAICAIVGLQAFALSRGIDGIALGASSAALGAIGGWWAKKARA